jgi:hypothetical protein
MMFQNENLYPISINVKMYLMINFCMLINLLRISFYLFIHQKIHLEHLLKFILNLYKKKLLLFYYIQIPYNEK